MPRLPRDDQHQRDQLVYQMVLDDVPYRAIGQAVGLSIAGVHKAVYRMMLATPRS